MSQLDRSVLAWSPHAAQADGAERGRPNTKVSMGPLHSVPMPPALEAVVQRVARLGEGEAPVELLGPLFDTAEGAEDLARILAFRTAQYRQRLQYLVCPEQQALDLQLNIDARSAHFSAERDGEVLGSVRLTPAPYEFASLSPALAEVAPSVAGHAELSRLVVKQGQGRAYVTTRLVVTAAAWALTAGFAGIVGLCRRETRGLFERYGLRPLSPAEYVVKWRGPQPYALMVGTWPGLLAATGDLSKKLNERGAPSLQDGPVSVNNKEMP